MLIRTKLIQKDAQIVIGFSDVTEAELKIIKDSGHFLNLCKIDTYNYNIDKLKTEFKTRIDSLCSTYLKNCFDIVFTESDCGFEYALCDKNKNSVFQIICETDMGCTQFVLKRAGEIIAYLDPKDRDLNRVITLRLK